MTEGFSAANRQSKQKKFTAKITKEKFKLATTPNLRALDEDEGVLSVVALLLKICQEICGSGEKYYE